MAPQTAPAAVRTNLADQKKWLKTAPIRSSLLAGFEYSYQEGGQRSTKGFKLYDESSETVIGGDGGGERGWGAAIEKRVGVVGRAGSELRPSLEQTSRSRLNVLRCC